MKGKQPFLLLIVPLLLVLAACSGSPPEGTLEAALTTPSAGKIYAAINASSTGKVSFRNNTSSSVTYTASESAPWLTIESGGTGTLAANATGTVRLRGTCGATTTPRTTTLTIATPAQTKSSQVTLYCSAYNIQLIYNSSITASQRTVFRQAAARWSRIITGDVPNATFTKAAGECGAGEPAFNGTVDDLVIYAAVEPIDGPGGILGSAGPCFIRTPSGLSIYGTMRFDSADVANLEAGGTFSAVILHEMGHVLGIGTLWDFKGLISYTPTTSSCRTTPTFTLAPVFTGTNARIQYGILGGLGNVPIEDGGGAGTRCGHWDEEIFDNELMTGFLNSQVSNPLSKLTIGSLADLGYQVNYANASSYSIPACSPTCLRLPSVGINIVAQEEILKPVAAVTSDGKVINLSK
jgi:hypothetical protein